MSLGLQRTYFSLSLCFDWYFFSKKTEKIVFNYDAWLDFYETCAMLQGITHSIQQWLRFSFAKSIYVESNYYFLFKKWTWSTSNGLQRPRQRFSKMHDSSPTKISSCSIIKTPWSNLPCSYQTSNSINIESK